MTFEKYQKMIQKIAHKVCNRYNLEYEDIEAQGYLIYCECVHNYNITRSSFSTYLYINLSGRLVDYAISTIRQKGINLYDLLNPGDTENDVIEDRCSLLASSDTPIDQDGILEFAKEFLSHDSYIIFNWIIKRDWEKKGRKKPSIYSAVETFGWKRTRVQKCWNECKMFWLNEGAAFCC